MYIQCTTLVSSVVHYAVLVHTVLHHTARRGGDGAARLPPALLRRPRRRLRLAARLPLRGREHGGLHLKCLRWRALASQCHRNYVVYARHKRMGKALREPCTAGLGHQEFPTHRLDGGIGVFMRRTRKSSHYDSRETSNDSCHLLGTGGRAGPQALFLH